RKMAKSLKSLSFRFCGPTTVYAFMQSMGMVNDHLVSCPGHARCAGLAASFQLPAA
ncbi:MAG: DNA-3-methyladenine glycosylase I, partial [Alphaproteobacteria bacterium]